MSSILRTRPARALSVAVALALTSVLLVVGGPAQAEPILGGEPTRAPRGTFTELQVLPITGERGRTGVNAFDAPAGFNPLDGYPETVPAGSTPNQISYMGLIPARDDEGNTALTYCIDLLTSTETGVTYERGDWTEANVPNLPYVGYILENYHPTQPQPADVPDNVKAAAVQAAIWFFSDNLVLDPTQEPQLYQLTSAIVADALENGPAREPAPPALSVSPTSASVPTTGELVGPFTVTADGPSTLRIQGEVEVFSDAAGTQQLAAGDTVPAGARLWVRTTSSETPQGFALQRELSVPESTVYLYDGNDPDRQRAQKLILAQTTRLDVVAGVRLTPYAAGGIAVTKRIRGAGAGLQGPVVIRVVCTPAEGGTPVERRVRIPARTGAGSRTVTLTGLPAEATCTITEPRTGQNRRVELTASSIEPGNVTVVQDEVTPVATSNTYAARPDIRSRTSDKRVRPGRPFHDRVRLTGLAPGTTVPATARLYGPFTSLAAATCRPENLARTVTWRAGPGWTRTPAVRVRAPGVYTWVVSTERTAANTATRTRCGVPAETTTVAKPSYPAPEVPGGFSGTLPRSDGGPTRTAPTLIRAPGIGLRASVVPTVIRGRRMLLPANVGATAWLRRSAAPGDRIGATVVAGHVSDRHDRPGALWGLSRAKKGQVVTVSRRGTTHRYQVSSTARFQRTGRLPHRFFTTTGAHRLVLISCTGRVVYANGHFHYTKYQVVVATPVGRKG
ncbi:DUF5979 domain-containing protein [Nocardioides marmotae]|uniref:DUF5979 domain-containing protein n=1 Tax=Nocardioides marmotae TaxID=2663857 RepID=UPI0012B67312|nr:DUF5979 domain-containing protein [Nocardioides marmotae]MBC9735092.1 Cys-Gln thioester bond-forming surface protein [Nocardioides marmotae]MTB86192.1 hypothetical protein [Nocardioides marmotae]